MKKMKIVLIEDKPEEMVRAQRAVAGAISGTHLDIEMESFRMDMVPLEFVFERLEAMKDTLSGVITDLHFYPRVGHSGLDLATVRKLQQDPPPAGLAVVIWCVARGIPVVICTDSYHHGADVTWFNDVGLRAAFGDRGAPFSLSDACNDGGENWNVALANLVYLVNKRNEEGAE
ncbi:MAG: hypothetical protein AAB402_02610 [Patescibacteria group bacterium]